MEEEGERKGFKGIVRGDETEMWLLSKMGRRKDIGAVNERCQMTSVKAKSVLAKLYPSQN